MFSLLPSALFPRLDISKCSGKRSLSANRSYALRPGSYVVDPNHIVETHLRRRLLLTLPFSFDFFSPNKSYSQASIPGAKRAALTPESAPDRRLYDLEDEKLRNAANLLEEALQASSVDKEEALWNKLIDEYGTLEAAWADDVVGRALGNRGNARARQGRFEEALRDYDAAIARCPWSPDPVLNRGVVLEKLGRLDEAIRDYGDVLAAFPSDPAAWNNLGNANAAAGKWRDALDCYDRAAKLAPQFAFAAANRALALFEVGEKEQSIRELRSLLRRYPDFPDARAALTAALWSIGKEADAETNWNRVEDARYKDPAWLRSERRWPPSMIDSLSAFNEVRSVP
uniref:Tpr repeat-containing protein n=1 Tax=Tetraselmis sp. GSL018 TaxID=582737 RepID=A0A061RVU0_9CHLO